MNKKILLTVILLFTTGFIFAQEASDYKESEEPAFKLVFTEGASFNQLTRIEVMEKTNNFVRETFLAGAFVNLQTVDLWFLDFQLQLGAYYPFYNTFNGMKQIPKNILNYAFDMYFGAVYSTDFLKYAVIDLSLGLHYMYQLTDEYHMNYVGLGTYNTIRFPISSGWSLVNSYFFSFDNPNLGTNAKVQPFNGSYQYHIDLGVRYSRKARNSYSFIH